ncbi:MAG TPA: hypothetical protein VFP92_01570 [Rhodanobacteraceae bacterium]|nr:hypothetical protein [Rhodanobacteraceae bacterium]
MARQRALDVDGALFLAVSGRGSLSRARIALLERIAASGSISQAARDVGMSYKAAWDAMDNLAAGPLVARKVGGRHGGGTQPTARGLKWSRCTVSPRPGSRAFWRGSVAAWPGSTDSTK